MNNSDLFKKRLDSNSRKNRVHISWKFAYSSVPHAIATFLGSGVLRPGPGTWGTLAGWGVFEVLNRHLSMSAWVFVILVTFFVGAWASQKTGEDIGVHDHGSIVIDEVFAIWLVLITVPNTIIWHFLGFLSFRFFDIIKVWPSDYLDRRFKNGLGVMLDDLSAAIQTIILLQVAFMAIERF